MPAKYRESLGEKFYILKGFDSCLFVYAEDEFNKFINKLEENNQGKKDVRAVQRFFYSSVQELEFDKQGRLLIPSLLKDFAEINKDVVILGVSKRIEIWSLEKWEAYLANQAANIDDLVENIDGFDL